MSNEEFVWNKEQWEIEEGKVEPGEIPTFFFHDDLGRFYIEQDKPFDNHEDEQGRIRLSLRQCMLMGEYLAAHIDQLKNLQTH